jgi:maleylpyruvate isomerase
MFESKQTIERLHQAQARLLARLECLTDDDTRQPSQLPDWTVGHVLSHLARNADSVVRRLEGAARGEIVDQYPGGPAGREAEIQAGAHTGAAELVADVHASGLAVEQVAAGLPDDAWERLSRSVSGDLVAIKSVLVDRIREVEVHHVDLGLGYQPSDWPAEFVREVLAIELPKLPGRADHAGLLAWLTGRGPVPALSPWLAVQTRD